MPPQQEGKAPKNRGEHTPPRSSPVDQCLKAKTGQTYGACGLWVAVSSPEAAWTGPA